jgi:hypothetical protein
MTDYYILCQIQYILLFLIYLNERLFYKYIKNKDIILNYLHILNYDKFHSLYILYILFNIQIYTIKSANKRIINIFHENKKISTMVIKNEKPINESIKSILSLYYLDKYNIVNLLEIYNCGIIIHKNNLFNHIYNYLGERRVQFQLYNITI